jgi:hypothetical protein
VSNFLCLQAPARRSCDGLDLLLSPFGGETKRGSFGERQKRCRKILHNALPQERAGLRDQRGFRWRQPLQGSRREAKAVSENFTNLSDNLH